MKVIPIKAQAGLIGFESAAAEYTEMELSLDELLIEKPAATWIGLAQGHSMELDGIFDGDDFSVEGVVTRSVRIHKPLNRKIGA